MTNKKWLMTIEQKKDTRIRLFCFPYAGGNASTYIDWSQYLPDFVEVIAIQPPGRANRLGETSISCMDELTDKITQSFSDDLLDVPYMVFGHSLGARVAFEVMIKMKKMGKKLPTHFFASASRAPSEPTMDRAIHVLPEREFLEELRELGGTPTEILKNSELMTILLPMLRSDFKLSNEYVYKGGERFSCYATIFYGSNDEQIKLKDVSGWDKFFTNNTSFYQVPGDHFYIDKNVTPLINRIKSAVSTL